MDEAVSLEALNPEGVKCANAQWDIAGVDSSTTIRKRRLRQYIDKHGGTNAVARASGYSSSYISQLASPDRPAGADAMLKLAEALGLPFGYFERTEAPELREAPAVEVPLYTLATVGTGAQPEGKARVAVPGCTLAVRMRGDSMASSGGFSIPDGALVFASEDDEPSPDAIVIARLPGATEATVRQLISDSGFRFLRPLNPAYPMRQLDRGTHIVATVKTIRQDLPCNRP